MQKWLESHGNLGENFTFLYSCCNAGNSRAGVQSTILLAVVVRFLWPWERFAVSESECSQVVDCIHCCDCRRISLMLLKCCQKRTHHRTLDCRRTLIDRHRGWRAAVLSCNSKYSSALTRVPPSLTEKSGRPSWIQYCHCGRNSTRFADHTNQLLHYRQLIC